MAIQLDMVSDVISSAISELWAKQKVELECKANHTIVFVDIRFISESCLTHFASDHSQTEAPPTSEVA